MWTIIGVGIGLAGLGTGGFTLLWRYIAAAEKRAEKRSAAVEKRAEERSAAVEKRAEERSAAVEKRAEERSAAVEKRAEERSAAIEKRAEARSADMEKRADARFADLKADLKADIHMLAERMERNHAELRHAIDNLILTDQAKRLTILEEAVLRTARPPDDRGAQH